MNILGFFQRFGRALQFFIAVLSVAVLLLRFGQLDLFNVAFIVQAGGAIFDNFVLIFVIGVVFSWSKDSVGAAALAGAVGYFVLIKAMVIINLEINMGVLAGIIIGLVGGVVYNRWFDIKLSDFLSFFGGKRFVSIVIGFFCLVLAVIFGYVWSSVQYVIYVGGEWIVFAGALGFGIFGFINRLLILIGLYQVLNIIVWFQIGEFINAAGTVFYGDINRFYVGDGIAGMFMFGFFSIMMFGLSGAALAMYFVVSKERRSMVGGMLFFVVVIAFLIGVIESLEFLFMFFVSLLYFLYVLLIGISLFVVTLLGIYAGFFFFAGVIDYALMYNLSVVSQNVWMLLVMGVIFFVIYFVVFSLVIRMFNLKTSGREDKEDEIVIEEVNSNIEEGLI